MDIIEAQRVVGDLGQTSVAVAKLVQVYHDALADAAYYRDTELSSAQRTLTDAEAMAQFEAYQAGAIDGKNQAQRDMQLTRWLAKDESVILARQALAKAERELAAMDAAAERCKGDYKAAAYRLNAARAQAQLLAAMMTMAAQGEDLGTVDEPEYEFGQAAF